MDNTTFRERLNQAKKTLENSTSPYLDALLLLSYITDSSKELVLTRLSEPWPQDIDKKFNEVLEKRRRGFPMSYITGTREFWGLDFKVGPGVLIPRPDTEIIVETVLDIAATIPRPQILDLCTGSGCIACALASEVKEAKITASDFYEVALNYARENIRRLAPGIKLIRSNLFDSIDGEFDIIVTNPPYVTDDEYEQLGIDVQTEPKSALVSGIDGLDHIRTIAVHSKERLRPGAYLCIEASPYQHDKIAEILYTNGYKDVTLKKDLGNRPRVSVGRRG